MNNSKIGNKNKTRFFVLMSVFLVGTLSYFGLRKFTQSVYNQRTCEWANIDNIEMHTRVNIPKIINSGCLYKKDKNSKMAWFDINTNTLDMEDYIKSNHFKKLNSNDEIQLDNFLEIDAGAVALKAYEDLYYTFGSNHRETWQTLLNASSGRLWVTLQYTD